MRACVTYVPQQKRDPISCARGCACKDAVNMPEAACGRPVNAGAALLNSSKAASISRSAWVASQVSGLPPVGACSTTA